MLLTYTIYGQIEFPVDAVQNRHPLLRYGWLGFAGAAGAFFSTLEVPDRKPTVIVFIGYVLLNLMTAVCEEEMFRRIFFGVLTHVLPVHFRRFQPPLPAFICWAFI